MSQSVSFNLVDEPWIRVRSDDGDEREVSLLELFEQAPHIKCLANDLPTQDFAILRMLLAILQRAISPSLDDDDDPADVWGHLWNARELPIDEIRSYLSDWHDHFDLFDEERPFMQVAGLQMLNEKMRGSGIWKIVADVPDGDSPFSLRAAKETMSLSFSEAARWLIHTQAFDTSGIKSATVGDPLALGGKRTSLGGDGVGWAGRLGGIYLEGSTLCETLLLNFVVRDSDNLDLFLDDDEPSWEKNGKSPDTRACSPSGRADLYTWKSRQMHLISENGRVVNVILTYGDLLDSKVACQFEPMTARRYGKDKKTDAFRPCVHQPDRALWRGLDSLFGETLLNGKPSVLKPGLVEWLSYLASRDGGHRLGWDKLLRMHAVGLKYDKTLSTVVNAVDDYLELSPFLLSKEGEPLVALAKECVSSTSQAINALGDLAANLRLASGEHITDTKDIKRGSMGRAYFEVDSEFRSWFADLGENSDAEVERARWRRRAHSVVKACADGLLDGIGPGAIIGAPVKDKNGKVTGWMTASKAEALFNSRLRKALPLEEDAEIEKGGALMVESPKKRIESYVHARIMSIQSDYLSPDRKPRGARNLAALRHALTAPIGFNADAWTLEFEGFPAKLAGKDPEPSPGECAVHYALSLYAFHQQSKTSPMHVVGYENRLGCAVGKLVRQEEERYSSLEDGEPPRRLKALVTAESIEEVAHYARQLVQLLRRAEIPVDYAELAAQLFDFQNPCKVDEVRLKWGREYASASVSKADGENQ